MANPQIGQNYCTIALPPFESRLHGSQVRSFDCKARKLCKLRMPLPVLRWKTYQLSINN